MNDSSGMLQQVVSCLFGQTWSCGCSVRTSRRDNSWENLWESREGDKDAKGAGHFF